MAVFLYTGIYNEGIIGSVSTGDDSTTSISNYGIIESITTGDYSSTNVNNNGLIERIVIGESSRIAIQNNAYIIGIFGGVESEMLTVYSGDSMRVKANDISSQNSQLLEQMDYWKDHYLALHAESAGFIPQGTGKTGAVTGNSISYKTIDFENMKAPQSYKDSIKQLLASINDPAQADMLDIHMSMLRQQLSFINSSYGEAILNTTYYTSGVGSGLLQGIGGFTETTTGWAVATGGSVLTAGLASEVAIPLGGYMMIDGGANMAEGAQKAINTILNKKTESKDSWNLIKRGMVNINPEYGEDIYNLTQIGIGVFNVAGDITGLPANAGKTVSWGKNIRNAQTWGSKTETQLVECAGFLILETKTQSGMMLQMTVLDGKKLGTQGFILVNDGYNTAGSASSIAN